MELQYEILDDDTVRIIKAAVSDDELEITIPKTYQDKKISEIGHEAFSGLTRIRKITLPESIRSIGNCAFSECRNLTLINIPEKIGRASCRERV